MRALSFEASEYTSPCGTLRVRRAGHVWSAEQREDSEQLGQPGRWVPIAGTAAYTHLDAIARALAVLGLGDPDEADDDTEDARDHDREWW